MCDCIKTVIIPIMPSLLLASRHFISFPFCWFWFTRGSQRAPSKGGELHPRGLRSVRTDVFLLETGNDLKPVMTHSMLPWFHRISAQRRRSLCPCMQLCGKCMPLHTTITQILCPLPAFMLFLSA